MDIAQGFTELRLSLADALSDLRSAKDAHEVARAEAEQRAVDSGQAGGKNEAERSRSLALALDKDPVYSRARDNLRAAERNVGRLEALLEGARDARRVDEWRIRAQLVEALNRAGVASDHEDRAGEGAFDDTAQDVLDDAIVGAVALAADRGAIDEEWIPF